MYVTDGLLKGNHGTIVGHEPGFSLFNDRRVPHIVRIMLASGTVAEVRKDHLRLVDLHGVLPLGVPKMARTGWMEQPKGSWSVPSPGWD